MDGLVAVCDSYYLPIIEDAEESLGSTYKGKKDGTIGKTCALVFYPNEVMLATNPAIPNLRVFKSNKGTWTPIEGGSVLVLYNCTILGSSVRLVVCWTRVEANSLQLETIVLVVSYYGTQNKGNTKI